MLELFDAYKRFPYKVPFRVKLTNVVRYFFTLPFLERFLVSKLVDGSNEWWKKFIPPMYFYKPGSIKKVSRDGVNYQLDVSMFLDHAIFFCRMDEDPSLNILFRQLRNDFIVLDVGANIGYLTLKFARACPKGFVYSFEPDSQNFQSLQTNFQLNKIQNGRLYKKGLGAQQGKAILYKYSAWNPGINRILSQKPDSKHQAEDIEVIALDQFVHDEKLSKVDLIKIDVEGFEKFVLEGAQQIIAKWQPILFVELVEVNLNQQGYSCIALIEYIESMGYEVKDAKTMLPIDRTNDNHNTDILCFSKKIKISKQ